MKTLYLLRHGKSSWGTPTAGDFERPLKERGIEAARMMGRHMASSNLRPDLVLCSAATRARQTLDFLMEGFGKELENRIEETLYLASPQTIIGHLHNVPDSIQSVMFVGHNPGLQCLALELATGSSEDHDRIQSNLPTAALVMLAGDQPGWTPIQARSFTLQRYLTPKTLQA